MAACRQWRSCAAPAPYRSASRTRPRRHRSRSSSLAGVRRGCSRSISTSWICCAPTRFRSKLPSPRRPTPPTSRPNLSSKVRHRAAKALTRSRWSSTRSRRTSGSRRLGAGDGGGASVTGGSDDVAAVEGAANPSPGGEQGEGLAGALRAIALRAAEHAGGGVALIYGMGAAKGAQGLRLRAAAGFSKPVDARVAAAGLVGAVQEVLRGGNHRTLPAFPGLGPRGAGGTLVLPLGFEGRTQGALVVAGPQPIGLPAVESLALSDAAKAGLRSALDDGTAFLRTLQNILDLWRIKQGELPVEIHEVSFREVVDEAIFSVQDTLGDKPVVIEKQLTEPLPKFRTDLAKLNQILFLLLDNAAKFTPKGRVTIRAAVKDGELQCELEDTGIGICPDDQQYIFDEFFQVDELESTRYRGAGLGLALVRDLLVLLEGGITLSSEVGRGTKAAFH